MSGRRTFFPGPVDGLAQRRYEGFVYQWRLIDGEKHTGTKAESYSRGLRFAFALLAPKA